MDVISLQIVTIGVEASARFERPAVRLAISAKLISHTVWQCRWPKPAAEYLHRHIRRELKIS